MTLTDANAMLDAYLAAERKVLAGQTVSWDGQTLTRADLAKIQAGRQEWERKVARLQGRRHALANFTEAS